MRSFVNRFWQNGKGNAAIEMALLLPILLAILAGITEVGRAFYQAAALERGLRAGATFAARSPLPLTSASIATTANLVKTASMDGSFSMTAANWAEGSSQLEITVTQKNVGSITVPVITITARVPFTPISQGLFNMLNIGNPMIEISHGQAALRI